MREISRKNIIITGGTRGLGLRYAKELAKNFNNIGLIDISQNACKVYDKSSLEEIMSELNKAECRVRFYHADLTSLDETERAIRGFVDEFKTIDGVIANAGGDISGSDSDAAGGKAQQNSLLVEYKEHQNIFKRNFDTCYHSLRSVTPYLKEQGYGRVVTVSSVNAGFGVSKETSYAIAKCAVLHLTRCAAAELRPYGINVNCLMPGPVQTSRFNSTLKNRNAHDLRDIGRTGRLERLGQPDDISPVAEFLLSEAARFISGQVIRVDGGLFTHPV